ncbi:MULTISPECIES: Trp biosynthesis-associated membrane protein [unclassified Arthrobacter]|uniref:Trp biosynthesis-associated membrane protein n=1 Tax=unclassified Arthrobacter TaxID=235627 RepID=UPI002E0A7CD8|nr:MULTISPECIES: Trp biosynthesis-associated membrane protein [unclassified Arthrobacter]MEC5191851.1 putative membrane protein (TIGR02234 family) [Arthrobacter sp. MP_M4]MEC5202356.1 putative membrane protein (TIGR02234 family) [Arthrobacter sp. MP_M7]
MSGTTVKSASPVVPRWARKSTLVLAIAALALAVFGTTTQTWLTVHLDPAQLGQAVSSQDGLPVQGSKAATTVTALALVALAGGLAASIAGRIARWIITALILLAAAGIVGAAAVVIADPVAAAQGSIAAATGITGSDVQVDVTAFPALAVAAGSLLGLSALLVIPAGRHWKSRTKYDTAAAGSAAGGSGEPAGPQDEIDSWDRLSRGDDPT